MRKHDWANALLYGIFTAITLALVLIFVQFLEERARTIELTLLITSAIAGVAILSYFIIRWFLSGWINKKISNQIESIRSKFADKLNSESDTPVQWSDFQKIIKETKLLTSDLWSYGRAVLALLAFMVVTVELLALANAAALYLQVKRLQEQNALIEAQYETQQFEFVGNSNNSIGVMRDLINETSKSMNFISENLIRKFNALNESVTNQPWSEVIMREFEPMVCEVENELCESISVDNLTEIADSNPIIFDTREITISEQEDASMRGYARFMKVAAMATQLLSSPYTSNRNLTPPEVFELIGNDIDLALATCDIDGQFGQITELWSGISTVVATGAIMINVQDTDILDLNIREQIVPGAIIQLDERVIDNFAGGLQKSAQLLNDNDTLPAGPKATAALFAQSLQTFDRELKLLKGKCEDSRDNLRTQIGFISNKRDLALKKLEN